MRGTQKHTNNAVEASRNISTMLISALMTFVVWGGLGYEIHALSLIHI